MNAARRARKRANQDKYRRRHAHATGMRCPVCQPLPRTDGPVAATDLPTSVSAAQVQAMGRQQIAQRTPSGR